MASKSSSVLNIAIIGAGGISGAHNGAVKASGGRVAVTAVVDPDAAAAHKLADEHGAQVFGSADQLVEAVAAGLDVHAVVVCTPPSVRIKIIAACLKAKLPVLMEKPIAHTLADARKLAALAAKHKKVPSFVAYCHRFAPAVLEINRLIKAGKVGKVTRFENVFACDLPAHSGKWFSEPKKAGGGAYLDMGSHSLDLLHFIVGPCATLGAVFAHKWKGRTETAATVLLKSTKKGSSANIPAGVAAVVASGWAETSRFTLAIEGDEGMLFYDYEKPAELVFKDLVGKAEAMPVEEHGVRFTRQLLAFADAVQRKAKTNLATFADGLAAAVAGEAAAKAAKKS